MIEINLYYIFLNIIIKSIEKINLFIDLGTNFYTNIKLHIKNKILLLLYFQLMIVELKKLKMLNI